MSGIVLSIFLTVITGVFAEDFSYSNYDGAMIGNRIPCICLACLTCIAIQYFCFHLPNERRRNDNPDLPPQFSAEGVAMTSTGGHMFQTTPTFPNQEGVFAEYVWCTILDGYQCCFRKVCSLSVFWKYYSNGGSTNGGSMMKTVITCICVIRRTNGVRGTYTVKSSHQIKCSTGQAIS
ncbi:hypothetical protein MAR_032059 [Mya arenaria]|uniref:Uncharacterized protein n=1 Tax=Mya arenaria TaxID=6604 RepID=A0ABY7F5J8_MYAAR|nr:hypothetical protein MAR_032059 [Mya arenaria]